MRFIELAEKRRSIRGYKDDPVPENLLAEILQAGRLAPSAKNLQPLHFIVVREAAVLDALAKAYPAPFFRQAPVVIATCVEPSAGWLRAQYDGKNFAEVDAAIAVDHMTLAAADLGLGSCWIGAFDPVLVRSALNLPDKVYPLALLPIGYPSDAGRPKRRKEPAQLVHYEKWSGSSAEQD
jgi:nitroreductase